jgi:hypothetical protein
LLSLLEDDSQILLHEGPSTDATIFTLSIKSATAAIAIASGSVILYTIPIGTAAPAILQTPEATPVKIINNVWGIGGETLFALNEN